MQHGIYSITMKLNWALILGAIIFVGLFIFIIAKPIEYQHSIYSRDEVGNANENGNGTGDEKRNNTTIIISSILFGVLLASLALGIYQSNKMKAPGKEKKE